MIGNNIRFCDYCQCSILVGQRWVREKVYAPLRAIQSPTYRHFHAELRGGQDVSCWERSWMERQIARASDSGREWELGTRGAVR